MKYSIQFSSLNLDWIIDSQAPAHRQIITIQKQGLSFLRARNQSSSLQSQNKCPKNTTDCLGSQLAPPGRLRDIVSSTTSRIQRFPLSPEILLFIAPSETNSNAHYGSAAGRVPTRCPIFPWLALFPNPCCGWNL